MRTALRILILVGLIVIVWAVVGCTPAPQAEGQLPLPTGIAQQQWDFIPMTGGPQLRTACVKGDRIYVMQSTPYRGNEWYMGSTAPITMAVAAGRCVSP